MKFILITIAVLLFNETTFADAIHEAVMNADIPGIEVELKKGVSIDLPVSADEDQEGLTPLALAIIELNFEAVEYLIENGADINSPIRYGEAEGYTPLFFAAPVSEKKYVELLIEKGADLNVLIPFGHAKGFTPLFAAIQEGRTGIAKLLIDNGAKVDLKGKNNFTALTFAAEQGQVAIGELLLSEGANINARADKNVTPLIIGAAMNHIEMVRFLISKGADLNAKTSNGYTALNTTKNSEVIELLKSHGGKSGKLSLIQIVTKELPIPIVSCICLFFAYFYRSKRIKHGGKTGEELKAEGK